LGKKSQVFRINRGRVRRYQQVKTVDLARLPRGQDIILKRPKLRCEIMSCVEHEDQVNVVGVWLGGNNPASSKPGIGMPPE
jgi:hypothetical protein